MNDVIGAAHFVSDRAAHETQFCLISKTKLLIHESSDVLSSKPKVFREQEKEPLILTRDQSPGQPGSLPLQLQVAHPSIFPVGLRPWVPRGSPRFEEIGPARDELRVPEEEEDGEHAEKDENGPFGKPVV